MTKTSILTLLLSILTTITFGQTPIDIAENTLKVSPQSEEVFYYGFAEGDQLIFNFEEVNGKELKELEITSMPSKSIFMDYKTKKIDNKVLTIAETGIYKFRFANANILSGRVCKFKIQRIPADEKTKKFNTTVFKRTIYDTTYYNEQERYIVKADTTSSEIFTQTAKVHSKTNSNGNKTTTNFVLPENTIAWSYYIGVDQAGQQAYDNAAKQLTASSTPMISKLIGSNPLVALALNLTSYLSQIQGGEDIDYSLVGEQNENLFKHNLPLNPNNLYKKGKVINDFSKMEVIKGNLYFCFENDNRLIGVSVLVKVTAIQLNAVYETREVKKMNITSRQEMYLKN